MTKRSERVQQAMAAAKPVEDAPFDLYAVPEPKQRGGRKAGAAKAEAPAAPPSGVNGGSGETPPPPPDDDGAAEGIDFLTGKQWKAVERCALLDENDADNGRRLLEHFGDQVLNVLEAGWHAWTGTHWEVETGQHAVERCAHQLIRFIKREAALIVADDGEKAILDRAAQLKEEFPNARLRPDAVKAEIKLGADVAKALASRRHGRFQFAIRSGDRGRTRAMIDQAEPHRTVLPKEMDREDLALNTASGTLRFSRELDPDCPDPDVRRYLVSKRLDPHRPEDLITKVTAGRYDPNATAPNFLRDFVRFMPDPEKRELLQVAMGYTALGMTGEQVFFFHYGDGSNWKSTFVQAIGRALGGYTKPMNYASISGNNAPSGDKPSPDWARLPAVRLLTIEEVPKREPLREELIKMVTSGSDMPVRHLNKGLFDMRTTFTAHMLSNGEPNITGADHGIWRRTLIVHWETKIPDDERLPFDQVMAMYEAERDGILNWIIEGIEKYLANGLKPYITPEMRAFTESVRRDRDAVGAFVDDCVLPAGEGEFVAARSLYKAFVRWCGANGVDPVPSETSFGLKIKRVPVDGQPMEKLKRSIEGMKRYYGIRLHNLPPDDTQFGAPSS